MTDVSTLAGLDQAAALIQSAHRIAVLSHIDPDADAIGSTLGIAGGLRGLGKDVTVAFTDQVPTYATFLPAASEIVHQLPDTPFDAYIFADAADIDRIGALYTEDRERFERVPLLNIDHHRTNPGYGSANYIDPGASSTSEIVYRLLDHLHADVSPDTATALLFGIMGDTGAFQNGATTPGSLQVAADLVGRGADSQQIAFQLFDRKRFGVARVWGKVLSNLELDAERRIVYGYLDQEMLRSSGVRLDEIEGITAYMKGIEEADVIMLLKESEEGDLRVSLRSRPDIDVSTIAVELGGGGHRQAAGATIPGPPDHARKVLFETYDRFYGPYRNTAGR